MCAIVVAHLAEVHTLHTLGTECRTHRRRRTRLPGSNYELNNLVLRDRLLRHDDIVEEIPGLLRYWSAELLRRSMRSGSAKCSADRAELDR